MAKPEDAEARKSRILKVARELFFGLGFRRVSMDELAFRLGMSKKTLYRFFPSKKDLLQEALEEKLEAVSRGFERIITAEQRDALEKVFEVFAFAAESMPSFSREFLVDMERHAPEVWRQIDLRREKMIQTYFGALFEEGILEGYFRRDLDAQLLGLMFSSLIHQIVSPENLSRLPLTAAQAFDRSLDVILGGILTRTGRSGYRTFRRSS